MLFLDGMPPAAVWAGSARVGMIYISMIYISMISTAALKLSGLTPTTEAFDKMFTEHTLRLPSGAVP